MCFSWKNKQTNKQTKFWLFFLNNSKNLRLGEKTKKKTFLEINVLYTIKVTINIFRDHFSSYLVWKTAKNPPNWKAKNRRFSKNNDIFPSFDAIIVTDAIVS